jgi:hypothetical protein
MGRLLARLAALALALLVAMPLPLATYGSGTAGCQSRQFLGATAATMRPVCGAGGKSNDEHLRAAIRLPVGRHGVA